ncbi:Glycosyltransferase involved in cell wall bisynthesis [Chryseobacterium shigense]|uniref:Glycosyltransferase involved in cell wall bisynthesis n=2 Tax=Chryseobacterium shigense TaxID=297244 RepID=A0A1N7IKN8_9FLAO|nr:Glycosyltransferase involved in cell wall bisynthesis [Chryseobacterium shigense]
MFNAEKTIIKCLNSVVNQLPPDDLEIVIVNDGSTDKSHDIVEKFINENTNFNIKLIDQENKGVSAARNLAIRESKHDFLALIDSDDVWLPGKLKHQSEILLKYDADFIGALHNNMPLGFPYKLEGDIFRVSFEKLMIKMAPSTITSLFKKDLIERAGFYDEKQKYTEDGNLWLRFSKCGKMIILNKNYAIAGDFKPLFGQSGLSGNLKGMYKGEIKNIKDMLGLKYINSFQYLLYFSYITLKYYRRIIIVKLRK